MRGGVPVFDLTLWIFGEPAMHGVFTRMLLHQLLEAAGVDRAEAARRAGLLRPTAVSEPAEE